MIAAEESLVMRRAAAVSIVVLSGLFSSSGRAQQPQTPQTRPQDLKTTAEASGFSSTSTYDDVVKFMKAMDEASTNIFYGTYGRTFEGRDMPIAIVGTGLTDMTPASVKATNKLRVHIQGNIHAGEVEGKESAQILLREFVKGLHGDWLTSTVFLITPIFNADGNEKFALNNRGSQHGPINGMGTRANGQGLNINRDFMKLETPEAQAFVKLWNDYDPHVGFDLHTSNGSQHAYYLTYSPPLNPNTSPLIMKMMKDEWFPFITKSIKAQYGWDTFYYGNAPGRGGGRGGAPAAPPAATAATPPARAGGPPATTIPPPAAGAARGTAAPAPPSDLRAWGTFEHVPRFHNNYVGMRNRFALLSEAYSYATFEDRIKATNRFMDAALTFAHRNADRIKKACAAADAERVIAKVDSTRSQMARGGVIEILMGETIQEQNPRSGANMNRRIDVVHPEQMIDMLWFSPSKTESVGREYYVPADATKAIALLQQHGVRMRQLTQPVVAVEQFVITANTAGRGGGGGRGRGGAAEPGRAAGAGDPGRAAGAGNPGRAAGAGDPGRAGAQGRAGGGTGRGGGFSPDTGDHQLRSLDGSWQPATGVTVPAGAWAVPMDQPLARLAFYLLAPTSDDGLTAWNFLDDKLGPDARTYPITRKR
jgi:hypothetical protein